MDNMTWKTVEITPAERVWEGNKGRDPYKTKCHYFMLALFIVGVLAIIGIGIWIGITIKQEKSTSDQNLDTSKPGDSETVEDILAEAVFSASYVRTANFSNWDGTTTLDYVHVVSPRNASAIQRVILAARKTGLRVRPVGGALSYSNLFPDEGQILLEMAFINKRENGNKFTINDTTVGQFDFTTVSAAAGLAVSELADFLVDNDLQIMTLPAVKEAQLGGIISTDTHGYRPQASTMSDLVVAVRYIDGQGKLRTADINNNPQDLGRLRCCLGLCGVLYDITFKVEPMVMTKLVQGFMPGSQLIQNATYLESVVQNNYAVELFYAPLSSWSDEDWALYMKSGQTPQAFQPYEDEWWYRFLTVAESTPLNGSQRKKRSAEEVPPLLSGLAENTTQLPIPPTQGPLFTELYAHKWAYDATVAAISESRDDVLPYVYQVNSINSEQLDKSYSLSTIIPIETSIQSDLVSLLEIVYDVMTTEYLSRGKLPILTIHLRWVTTSSNCVLCPEYYADGTATQVLSFELVGAWFKPGYIEFLNQVIPRMRQTFPKIRVQWAKFYSNVNDINNFIHQSMADKLSKMQTKEKNSTITFDDIFSNSQLRSIIASTI